MNGPESATPRTDLPPKIRRAPGLTLSAAEAELLARAFAGQPEIFVEREFRSGYSGAVVLLVSPGSGQAQVVVKLGPPGDLRREYAAYRQFVEKSAPQNTARLQNEPIFAPDGQLALLSYTFAGGDPRLPTRSLHAYYDNQGGQATAAVLDRVFRIYGRQWWANNRPRKFGLAEQYDRLLPVHLKLNPAPPAAEVRLTLTAGQTSAAAWRDLQPGQLIRLCDFEVNEVRPDRAEITLAAEPPSGEASAPVRLRLETPETATYPLGARLPQVEGVITATRQTLLAEAASAILPSFEPNAPHFTLAGRTYQNPLFDLSGVLDRVIEARESIIHGDLNLQNILVDGDTGFAWLIDFAETRPGPTLFDVQRLEAQVITKLLPPAVTQAGLEPVVVADLMQALHADPPSPVAPHPALQEPYTLLVALRRLARQYLMDDRDWEEYYLGLRLVLVGTLKYTDLLPIGHRLALVGAAVAKELMGKPVINVPVVLAQDSIATLEVSATEPNSTRPRYSARRHVLKLIGGIIALLSLTCIIAGVILPKFLFIPSPSPRGEGIVAQDGEVVVTGPLPIYSLPGEGYPVLGTLADGSSVLVVGRSADGNWLKITHSSRPSGYGWVEAEFVLLRGNFRPPVVLPSPFPTVTPTSTPTVTPTPLLPPQVGITVRLTNGLNVYHGPDDEKYEIAGTASAGAEVSITGRDERGEWLQILYPAVAGGYGWIEARFDPALTAVDPATLLLATALPPPTVTATPTNTPTSTFTPSPTATPTNTPRLTPTPSPFPGTPTAATNQPREFVENVPIYLERLAGLRPTSSAFSPDGNMIATTEGANLYILRMNGNLETLMTRDLPLRQFEGIVWSPNGILIAFTAREIECVLPGCELVGIILTSDPGRAPIYLNPPDGYGMRLPRWTQDGRLLVTIHQGDLDTVYIYDAGGRGQVAEGTFLLSSSAEGQQWSPWLPGKSWTVDQSRPTNYYTD